jgi:catechol 2,3-dioxygenase-like lactoylglutathione lyase family enzyme
MQLGSFSLSLSVRDLGESLAFYRTLGFEVCDDHRDEHWVVLRNGEARIGLFQGMLERNVLSFRSLDLEHVIDGLRRNGVEVPDDATGSHFLLKDPDGNPVLIDQVDPDREPQPLREAGAGPRRQ